MSKFDIDLDKGAENRIATDGESESLRIWTGLMAVFIAPAAISVLAGFVCGYLGAVVAIIYRTLFGPIPVLYVMLAFSASGSLLGLVLYMYFWARMLSKLIGPRKVMKRSGLVKIERKTDEGRRLAYIRLSVSPDYLDEMAELVTLHERRPTQAWLRFFPNREALDRFRDELVRQRLAEWVNPANYREGMMWTELGLEYWKELYDGRAGVEPYPSPTRAA